MIYPNPTDDLLFVQGPENVSDCSYEIRNIAGQLVMHGDLGIGQPILVGELSKAVYILQVVGNDEVVYLKWIKN